MSTILAIALVIYLLGVLYGAWVGLTILAQADCDHALLLLLPLIVLGVALWPLLPFYAAYRAVLERAAGTHK